MISGRDFIVLADDWNGLPTSTIHLFRRISQSNRVFWFNMVNRMPRLTWKDAKKAASVVIDWVKRSPRANGRSNGYDSSPSPGLNVVTPFMVPWFKPAVRRLNCISITRTFKRLCRRYEIHAPIVFAVFPSAADFVKAVDPALKIYYCYDEFLEYPGFNVPDWRAMENDLLDSVDALVVTSRDLESKNRRSCPSLYLPHGVDFEHFNQAAIDSVPISRMENIPKPIVGFFGLISEWVDLKLLATLSRAFPDVSFVLIGKSEIDTEALAECPNLYRLGLVPYDDLPQYANYFDVALIPFVNSKLTVAVNPLKLMEYFALGLPVVGTRLPELEAMDGPIYLAATEAEFCERLREILADNSPSEAAAAVGVARQNNWDQRVEELSDFIDGLS